MCYTAKNGRHRKEPVYEKERVFGGNGAVGCQLGAVSAPDEKGGRTAEKAAGEGQGNEQINIPRLRRGIFIASVPFPAGGSMIYL